MASSLPPVAMTLQKHVMEHVKVAAQEQAVAAMAQQGAQVPPEQQEAEVARLTAQFQAQGMQQLRETSMQLSGAGQPDPLIQLKEQELQLRAQKDQADANMDSQKLNLDAESLQMRSRQFGQRLDSQERATKDRIDSAMDREILKQRGLDR